MKKNRGRNGKILKAKEEKVFEREKQTNKENRG
jgi:hypothetical protein